MSRPEIDELVELLESDEVQKQLLPGFQQQFGKSLPEQWHKSRIITPRQEEILRDIVERYAEGHKRSGAPSRRYEGFDKGRHSS